MELRNYMILLADAAFLGVLDGRHARLRDDTAVRRRSVSGRAVDQLRSLVMAQSLDLDSLDAAITDFSARED